MSFCSVVVVDGWENEQKIQTDAQRRSLQNAAHLWTEISEFDSERRVAEELVFRILCDMKKHVENQQAHLLVVIAEEAYGNQGFIKRFEDILKQQLPQYTFEAGWSRQAVKRAVQKANIPFLMIEYPVDRIESMFIPYDGHTSADGFAFTAQKIVKWIEKQQFSFVYGKKSLETIVQKYLDINKLDGNGYTSLHYAVQNGNYQKVERLISEGADINVKDKWEETPLYIGASRGHKNICEIFLDKGADINATDHRGQSPLHQAARNGQKDVVELLIADGANVNAKNNQGETPLDIAVNQDHSEIVKMLISKGADVSLHTAARAGLLEELKELIRKGVDVNAENKAGKTALDVALEVYNRHIIKLLVAKGAEVSVHAAAFIGDINKVKNFLEQGGSVGTADASGQTLLHYATAGNCKDVAELLVSHGAEVNAVAGTWMTPLGVAARTGSVDVAEYLIGHGANVDGREGRWTPLQEAAYYSKEMVELLLAHGANINVGKWTALHSALDAERSDIVELLLAKGADVNIRDDKGRTPLHIAAWYAAHDNPNVVELLLYKGANINAKDNNGKTALSYAIEHGHTEIVKVLRKHGANEFDKELEALLLQAVEDGDVEEVKSLLSKGADVNTRDWRGTVLHIAMQNGHEPLVKTLINYGANVDARHASGVTTLHDAALYGHKDVTELLIKKGANVRVKDSLGYTPLHSAASGGHRDVAELLIDKGAEVNAKQKEDRTPLHEAVGWGHADVTGLLVSKGADAEAQDKDGRTPLWYAKASRNKEIVRLLSQEMSSHDVAVTNISMPASFTQGDQGPIGVNVVNRTDSSETLSVILTDTTLNAMVGAKSVHLSPTGVNGMDEVCDMVLPSPTTDSGCFGQYADLGGDVNGDGYNDLMIPAPRWNKERGRVYLYYGGPNMDPNPDKIFEGEYDGERFGEGLCLGDLNGDNYDDVILGACKYNDMQGRVYVFYGGTDMDLTCDLTIDGEAGTTGAFGYIIKIGDLDSDGHNDLLVTAPNYTNSWKGRAYLYYGGGPMDIEFDKVFEGENANDHFGIDAVIGGDVDDDGYNDILMGAIFYPSRNPEQGRAYLYYGSDRANMDTTSDVVFTCPEPGKNEFGYVETFDIDNDSHADVLIGARSAFNYRGQVYLYWGGERDNMDSIPDKVFAIKDEGCCSLGGNRIHCGYFNDDGYGDIAVAAYMWYRFDHTGRIYLFHGNTKTLLDSDPDKIFTGVPLSDFGKFFNIGDLNNDNYSDILAGAWRYNHFQGRAWLYYGGPGDSTQLKFNWDTANASPGKHTLRASIAPVEGEENLVDNTMTVGVEVKAPSN